MHGRDGFTMAEVMIALVVLSLVLLGLAGSTGQFLHTVTVSDRRATAIELADDRIELIQSDPSYGGLDTLYQATETDFPTVPGITRTTEIVHVGGQGQPVDYKKITVTVAGLGLLAPVARTVTVAAP